MESRKKVLEAKKDSCATAHRNQAARNRLEDYRLKYLKYAPQDNFDRELWQSVEIENATLHLSGKTGSAHFSLITPDRYSNFTGNMQGGAIATLLDGLMVCTLGLIARKSHWEHNGVSKSINISFIRPIARGTKITAHCEILHASNRLATLQGTLYQAEDNKVLATCLQDMVAITKAKL